MTGPFSPAALVSPLEIAARRVTAGRNGRLSLHHPLCRLLYRWIIGRENLPRL